MLKNNICNIKNEYDSSNKMSTCLQLSVVDETKTDMEYNCFECEDTQKYEYLINSNILYKLTS